MATETNTVITELIIRSDISGAAQYVSASKQAEAAANKLSDTEEKAYQTRQKQAGAYIGTTQSIARLRGEYTKLQAATDPVFAAQVRQQKEMERAILVTDAAVRRGVTTEQQAAATISSLRQKQLRDLQAVKDATQDVIRLQRSANDNAMRGANTANIAAQFQDIGVTAAMGMSPLQIALQQGTQISAAFGNMGAAGAVKALGAAFMSIISPISLVTIGLVAGTAALIQYFTNSDSKVDDANEKLKEHIALIDGAVKGWEGSLPGLTSYVEKIRMAADAAERIKAAQAATADIYEKPTQQTQQAIVPSGVALITDLMNVGESADNIRAFQTALEDLRAKVADQSATSADARAVIDALGKTFLAGSDQADTFRAAMEKLAPALDPATKKVAEINLEVGYLNESLKGLVGKLPGLNQFNQFQNSPFQTAAEMREWTKAYEEQKKAEQSLADKSAGLLSANQKGSDIAWLDYQAEAAKKAATAQDKLTSSVRRTIESATERNAQMRIELQYLGDFSADAQAAVYAQQLMNQAMSDGKSLTSDQTAEIRKLAQSYAELSQALGIARTEQGLQFERDQLSRSPVDQRIYATLRNLGLDLNSIDGKRIADNIRINEELETQWKYTEKVRDTLKNGASNFLQDLFSGKDVMESIVSLGSKFASMNFDIVVDRVSKGGLGNLFGGASPSAPVVSSVPALGTVARPAEVNLATKSATSVQRAGNAFLDLVASRESGRDGYNATLGNGAFTGGKRTLVTMTLSQIDDLQTSMLNHPNNSYGASPVGRYQIVRETLRGLKEQYDLTGDTLFTPKLQDELAIQLAKARGGNANGLRNEWEGLRGVDSATIEAAYRKGILGQTEAVKNAVETGALQGTSAGAESGTLDAWAGLRKVSAKQAGGQAAGGGGDAIMQGLGSALGGFSTGYQSADPLMGALGGAIQGAAGGPIGMIIGAIAGAVGGFLGAKNKVKQARRELEKQMNAINDLLDIGFGKGMGQFQKRLSEYLAEVDKAVPLAWKAKDWDLVDKLHQSWNAMFLRLRTDFYDMFDETMQAYSSGYGLESPVMKGAKALADLREELRNMVADVRYFGEETIVKTGGETGANYQEYKAWMEATVAEAEDAAKKMILAFIGGREEFTEYESAVMSVKGALDVAQTALEELGMSAEAAAQALDKQLNAALARLQSTFIDDLSRSLYELADMDYMSDLLDAQDRYNTRLRDATALGLSADLANRELALSLRNIVREAELTDDQIRQLAAALPELSAGLMGLLGMSEGGDTAQALSDAQAKVEDAKAALRSAYEKERSELESTISRLKSFTEGIRDFRDSLRLDKELSPLDAYDRLLEAQRQFEEVSAKALGGDETAQGRLEDVSRAYLEEARAYYGSNEMYYGIWENVDSTLEQALAAADGQLSNAEKQLSSLEKQVGKLIDLDDGVKSVNEAIKDLHAAQAEEASAQAADDAYKNSIFAEMLEVLKAQLAAQQAADLAQQQAAASTANYSSSDPVANAYRSILGREPDAAGYAFYSGNLNSGITTVPEIEADLRRHAGMADGGWVTGGRAGVDSVLRMLMPQEFVMPAAQAQRYAPQLEAMRSGQFGAANDNSALIATMQSAMRALQQEVEALRATVAQGFSRSVESTDRTAGAMEQGNRRMAMEARRKDA